MKLLLTLVFGFAVGSVQAAELKCEIENYSKETKDANVSTYETGSKFPVALNSTGPQVVAIPGWKFPVVWYEIKSNHDKETFVAFTITDSYGPRAIYLGSYRLYDLKSPSRSLVALEPVFMNSEYIYYTLLISCQP